MGRSSELEKFAQDYFGVQLPRFGRHAAFRRYSRAITTIVIDTQALTNGDLIFEQAVSHTATPETVMGTASRALVGHTTPLSRAVPTLHAHTEPIAIIDDRHISGTVWHDGGTYTSTWVGKATSIAQHADLTANEREHLLLQCRQYAASGRSTFLVAQARHSSVPAAYSDVRSSVIGLLVLRPHLYRGISHTIATMRVQKKTLLYISKDAEHTVETLAQASHLVGHTTSIPFVYRFGKPIPRDAQLYASLDDVSYHACLRRLDPSSMVIVREPLPQFWERFTTLSQ